MTIRSRRAATVALAVLSLAGAPGSLRAQCGVCDDHKPRLEGEALTLGANALLGGLTAGVRRALAGERFVDAFAAGAAGGALTYVGKRISVEEFGGAGLLGREVAAVGSSVTRNVGEGRPAFSEIVLPVGPVRMYVGGAGAPVHAKVDVAAVAVAAYTMTLPDATFDAAESLSAGALVFRRDGGQDEVGFNGAQAAGVIQVRDRIGDVVPDLPEGFREGVERSARHERVHVIQYDQGFLLWSAPAEGWLMSHAGMTRGVHRWIDLGLNAPALAGIGAAVPYGSRPWEAEAFFLSRTRVGPGDDTFGRVQLGRGLGR